MGTLNGHRQLSHLEAAVTALVVSGVSNMGSAARLHLHADAVRCSLRSPMRRWAANDRKHLLSLGRATPAT